MAGRLELPLEVVHAVLLNFAASPNELAVLALVCSTFHKASRSILLHRPTLSSSTQLRRFNSSLVISYRKLSVPCTRMTVTRGTRTKPVALTTGRGKAKRTEQVEQEDNVTEEDLLALLQTVGSGLEELHLLELAFTTLRRRQLGFVGQLAQLKTISYVRAPAYAPHS